MAANYQYLISLLKEEAAQCRVEVHNIRNSLRYRAGSLLVEIFPLSRRSFSALRNLLRLLVQHSGVGSARSGASPMAVPEAALLADTLIFVGSAPVADDLHAGKWVTNDAALLATVMDTTQYPRLLVLQQLDQIVLRRLARWQMQGGRVTWQPLPSRAYSPVLLGYLQSLLNNPIEPSA